jgi:hypothetical protein
LALTYWLRFRYPLLLTAIVIGFYWKLVFTNEYTWLQAPDFASQLMPWYQFQVSEWHAGRIPLWTPYEWGGQSLIGQAQPGVVDPLNLLLYAAPLQKNGWISQKALHWFYVSGYICCALSFYAFARRGLLVSQPASAIAALAFALSGIPASTNWPQMMHASIWAPLALLFQFRAARENTPLKHGALSGAFLGIMWLSGHHQIPLYFTLFSALLWAWLLYERFVTKPKLGRAAIAAGVFLFLFGAIQVLPMSEYGRSALRWVSSPELVGWQDKVPYSVHERFSVRPLGLLSLGIRTAESYEPFMGVVITVLAGIGLCAVWRTNPIARWLVAAGAAALIYALGANAYPHGLLYAFLPAIEKARVPAVAMVVVNFAVASFVGFGVQYLQKKGDARKAAMLVGILALAFMIAAVPHEMRTEFWMIATGALIWMALLLRFRPSWTPVAAGAAMLLELSAFTPSLWDKQSNPNHGKYLEPLSAGADIAAFLQKAPGSFRINYSTEDMPFSYGDYWGFETVMSFTASVPAVLWNLDPFNPAVQDFASIKYEIAKTQLRPGQLERFHSKTTGLKVFENPDVFPRAWMVHRVRTVPDRKAVEWWLKTAGEERSKEALFYDSRLPKVESCDVERDSVIFLKRLPNRLKLYVKAACAGVVVVNDNWDSGWTAKVDGRTTRVWQVDGFARGIAIDSAGDHEIELIYRPSTVIFGGVCLLLGIVGVAILTRSESAPK